MQSNPCVFCFVFLGCFLQISDLCHGHPRRPSGKEHTRPSWLGRFRCRPRLRSSDGSCAGGVGPGRTVKRSEERSLKSQVGGVASVYITFGGPQIDIGTDSNAFSVGIYELLSLWGSLSIYMIICIYTHTSDQNLYYIHYI